MENTTTYKLHISQGRHDETIDDLKKTACRKAWVCAARTTLIAILFIALLMAGSHGNEARENPIEWLRPFYGITPTVIMLLAAFNLREELHNLNVMRKGLEHLRKRDFGEYNIPTSEDDFRRTMLRYYVFKNRQNMDTYANLFKILLLIAYAPKEITVRTNHDNAEICYMTPCCVNTQFNIPETVLFRFFTRFPKTEDGQPLLSYQ